MLVCNKVSIISLFVSQGSVDMLQPLVFSCIFHSPGVTFVCLYISFITTCQHSPDISLITQIYLLNNTATCEQGESFQVFLTLHLRSCNNILSTLTHGTVVPLVNDLGTNSEDVI